MQERDTKNTNARENNIFTNVHMYKFAGPERINKATLHYVLNCYSLSKWITIRNPGVGQNMVVKSRGWRNEMVGWREITFSTFIR